MAITVTMPQMGESVVEGTIERWLVQPGEAVEKDQTLCEVTTDKVDAEIPAPEAGVITRLLVPEGTTVEVGAELAELDPSATPTVTRAETAPSSEPAPASASVAESAAVAAKGSEPETGSVAAPASESAAAQGSAPGKPAEDGQRVSPLARRLAEEHGVDLAAVEPSDGLRVTREDVAAHLARRPGGAAPETAVTQAPAPAARPAPATSAPAPAPPGTLGEFLSHMRVPTYRPSERDHVVPFTTIRKRIAEHMVVSKIVSPHVGTVAEVDMARVVALRERAKGDFEREHGFRLTYLPFVVAAVVRALREVPRMNATVVDQQIVERDGVHIGVAVETERGLVVPVVRDADRYSLTGIAQTIQDLATRARNREITADELYGGTFTVTNPGREGNLYGFAVINQPQVGILRTGEIKKRPVVVEVDGEDTLAIRPMMYLALSYDHRIIDGVTGNGFLYRVARTLEAGEFEV